MNKQAPTRSPSHVLDPVCGMSVDPDDAPSAVVGDSTFYFCSEGCRDKFQRSPARYIVEHGAYKNPAMKTVAAEQPATAAAPDRPKGEKPRRARRVGDYVPLIVVVTTTALAAAAGQAAFAGPWDGRAWMHDFMGFFLVVFAMLKLFDLRGFADGFQMYDLLAKPVRPYAYIYPLVELGLGLAYLARWRLPLIYAATVIVLVFGALGVINALRRGLDVNCACMGSSLKVPLSTVALVEDLGMAAMAAAMWLTLA